MPKVGGESYCRSLNLNPGPESGPAQGREAKGREGAGSGLASTEGRRPTARGAGAAPGRLWAGSTWLEVQICRGPRGLGSDSHKETGLSCFSGRVPAPLPLRPASHRVLPSPACTPGGALTPRTDQRPPQGPAFPTVTALACPPAWAQKRARVRARPSGCGLPVPGRAELAAGSERRPPPGKGRGALPRGRGRGRGPAWAGHGPPEGQLRGQASPQAAVRAASVPAWALDQNPALQTKRWGPGLQPDVSARLPAQEC